MSSNQHVAQMLKKKGDHDVLAARALFQATITPDIICFHCHQAIEKYIKAILANHGQLFPRSHDLEVLVDLITPIIPTVDHFPESLFLMTQYAVSARYGEVAEPDMEDAEQAMGFLNDAIAIFQYELDKLER